MLLLLLLLLLFLRLFWEFLRWLVMIHCILFSLIRLCGIRKGWLDVRRWLRRTALFFEFVHAKRDPVFVFEGARGGEHVSRLISHVAVDVLG